MGIQHFASANFDQIDLQDLKYSEMPPCTHVFGTPKMQVAVLHGDGQGAGTVVAWTCDKDGFSYKDLPSPETAFILEGTLRLTSENGNSTDIQAGESYLLPEGWTGKVEAIKPVRKVAILL